VDDADDHRADLRINKNREFIKSHKLGYFAVAHVMRQRYDSIENSTRTGLVEGFGKRG